MSIRVARKKPDAYQHGDLRRALVQAGLKLLTEDGLEGLTLRGAAELAGVSHAAPYRHFRDKGALVAAIAEEGFHLLTASMRAEVATCAAADVSTRLRAAGQGYVAFAVKHPAYFRTMFGGCPWPAKDAPDDAGLRDAGQEAYDVLKNLVEEGLRTRSLRPGDADQISVTAWSQVHGLAMLIIDGQLRDTAGSTPAVRALTEGTLLALERGLRAEAED
jgi:AcrR family transcriptional regulator